MAGDVMRPLVIIGGFKNYPQYECIDSADEVWPGLLISNNESGSITQQLLAGYMDQFIKDHEVHNCEICELFRKS
jgi:hypothetical protein